MLQIGGGRSSSWLMDTAFAHKRKKYLNIKKKKKKREKKKRKEKSLKISKGICKPAQTELEI